MRRSKDELPKNWFKRISRKKHRGREYYFNAITKERLWHHPLKDVAKESVVEWLNQNETQSADGNPYNSPSIDSECDNSNQCTNDCTTKFSSHLEDEYKKFELALAIPEKEAAIYTTNDSSSTHSPFKCNNNSTIGSFDTQSTQSVADDQVKHEVSSLRHYHESRTSLYLVTDTNTFLNQLTFLETFLHKIEKVPGQLMLVIPYVVLQQLDELQMRIETPAMDAIAFISHHLKRMPNHIGGQSAMNNDIQLIQILNPNDSIINCCLQLKQSCEHVVLLTNELSLSNKAICSHIDVYTQREFEAIVFGLKKDL